MTASSKDISASKPIEVQSCDKTHSVAAAAAAANTDTAVDFTSFGGSFVMGDYLIFRDIDFGEGGYKTFMIMLAANQANAGKKIEVRLDSPTGEKIGDITLTNTGNYRLAHYVHPTGDQPADGAHNPFWQTAEVTNDNLNNPQIPTYKAHYINGLPGNITGTHDVFFVFPAPTDVDMDFFVFSQYGFTPYNGTDDVGAGRPNTYEAINESAEVRNTRMKWWRDAAYGMFIHFGPYAFTQGLSINQDGSIGPDNSPGGGEWVMRQSHPQRTTTRINYAKNVASPFNPGNWDAKVIVKLAQEAGQKYIVMTTRHHDGFSMYDTKIRAHKDWSITSVANHGGFKRDLVRELADACHATTGTPGEVRFIAYLTLPDWYDYTQYPRYGTGVRHLNEHHGEQINYSFNGATPQCRAAAKSDYLSRLKGQLRELIVDYGAHAIWWDDANMLKLSRDDGYGLYHYMRTLNPNLITNNRIFTDREHSRTAKDLDFYTAENSPQELVRAREFDMELCQTLNDTWGYRATDHNWKSPLTVINYLLSSVSNGANLLLNMGPDDSGQMPPKSAEVICEVGEWLKMNGDAIYGTRPAFYELAEMPRQGIADNSAWLHVYATAKKGKLYLIFMPAYTLEKLILPAMANNIIDAGVLGGNISFADKIQVANGQMLIDLTNLPRNQLPTVIEMSIDGDIPRRAANGEILKNNTTADNTDIFAALKNALAAAQAHTGDPLASAEFGLGIAPEIWNAYVTAYEAARDMLAGQESPPSAKEINNMAEVLQYSLKGLIQAAK